VYKNLLVPIANDDDPMLPGMLRVAGEIRSEGGKITLLHVVEAVPGFVQTYLPEDTQTRHRRDAEAMEALRRLFVLLDVPLRHDLLDPLLLVLAGLQGVPGRAHEDRLEQDHGAPGPGGDEALADGEPGQQRQQGHQDGQGDGQVDDGGVQRIGNLGKHGRVLPCGSGGAPLRDAPMDPILARMQAPAIRHLPERRESATREGAR